jgi:DNA-binding transcriptional ArsR family regulator
MLKYVDPLEDVFHALGDPTRRRMVEQLSRGPASVSELAAPLPISLPAVVQHLQVLQECGLVESEKVGRVRTCRVRPATMRRAEVWIAQRRAEWEQRLDRLGELLAEENELAEHSQPAASEPEEETQR